MGTEQYGSWEASSSVPVECGVGGGVADVSGTEQDLAVLITRAVSLVSFGKVSVSLWENFSGFIFKQIGVRVSE